MRSTECTVQAVNNVAFIVERRVFLMGRCLKTESFETTQSDYSHRTGCPAPLSEGSLWNIKDNAYSCNPRSEAERTPHISIITADISAVALQAVPVSMLDCAPL
jgi:hypothetical protein